MNRIRIRRLRRARPLSVALALTFGAYATAGERATQAAQLSPSPEEGRAVLDRMDVVRQVLERNPSLGAAREAWQSALARRPQETAFEDPTLSYSIAPLSIASDVRLGQELQLSQSIPFPGKRGLRGEIASAEAEAMRGEWESARLRLALMASMIFDEWFLLERSLETTAEHLELVASLKKSAEAQYVAGRASQQDALQAEVVLSQLLQERISLEAARERLRAQLNALLHRPASAPLPSPPEALAPPTLPRGPADTLQEQALRKRPELAALRARVGGSDAAVRLAKRSYFPDLMVMGAYNSMFMDTPHQFMAGISVNIPIFTGKRRASVDEAEAERRRLQQEELSLLDEIQSEVAQAVSRFHEAHRSNTLLHERVLPAAKDQLAAARAGFEAGKNSFQTLLEAERNLRSIQLQVHQSAAALQSRQAELARTLGSLPGLPDEGDSK